MVKKLYLSIIILLLSAQITAADIDSTASIETTRWYKVYWSGIHVADLLLEVSDEGMDAFIDSYGIVKKISKYESRFKSKYDYIDGKYKPLSYYTEFQQRNGGRKIDIKYEDDGNIAQEQVTPPDNRAKRPAVEDVLKQDSVDPLTAVMVARQKVKENLAKNIDNFSFDMYDGRRLSKLDFTIHGRFAREIQGVKHNIVKVTFKRVAISGYTKNELRRMKKEEPIFTLYLSDDEYLMPIKADADAPVGVAVILLEKICQTKAECAI